MANTPENLSFGKVLILLVSEDLQDQDRYQTWLQRAADTPFEIMAVSSGKQARDICKHSKPDCVLLNDQLSDMDGLEFLATLEHFTMRPTFPVLYIVSHHEASKGSQALKSGAQEFVHKSKLSEELLWHLIHHAIERQRIIQRIWDLEVQYNTILQSSLDGMIVIGNNGEILFSNQAAEHLFQRSSADLRGTPFGFPVVAGQTSEIAIDRQDETATPVEMRVVPIEWEHKTAYLASLRDLTERRKAEEERQRLELERQYAQKLESLGVLAGGIAHDFNNLLMTIVARSGLALRSLPGDSPAREHITFIEKSGLRGGELANQMLTFAGKTKLDFQPIALSKFLKEMETFLRATISKRMTLTFDLEPALPSIRADPAQLRQIIMNIVTNASEAHDNQEGRITISTQLIDPQSDQFNNWYLIGDLPTAPCPALQVQDTGCGMPADTIPKIFDPFFSTKFPGRGLGLAALLGIVRAHSAMIAIKSEPKVGTSFYLAFPPSAPTTSRSTPTKLSVPATKTVTEKKPVILIIDDEEEVRVACSLILQELGCDALVAADGEVGIQVFEQHREDISAILLDLTMPKLDGQQCLKQIRGIDPEIPVILSSGFSEEESLKQFQDSGINAFIQKPYQVEVLIEKIQTLIPDIVLQENPFP